MTEAPKVGDRVVCFSRPYTVKQVFSYDHENKTKWWVLLEHPSGIPGKRVTTPIEDIHPAR